MIMNSSAWKRWVPILLSVAIMAAIIVRLNLPKLTGELQRVRFGLLLASLGLFIPQIYLFSVRWRMMIRDFCRISLGESIRLILAATSLNVLLPSKLGDFSKAYFLKRWGGLTLKRGANLVFFERYLDLCALGVVAGLFALLQAPMEIPFIYSVLYFAGCLLSVFFLMTLRLESILPTGNHPPSVGEKFKLKLVELLGDTREYLKTIQRSPGRLLFILALSAVIWLIQVYQFHMLFACFHRDVPAGVSMSLIPQSILAGLLPITVAGIGTRDSALIYLFRPWVETEIIAGVGVLATIRYLIPALIGIPYLNRYIAPKETLPHG